MDTTPHEPDAEIDEQAAEVEDFDAWRAQQKAKRGGGRRVKMFGAVVTLPTSVPLGLTISMDELADSSSIEDVQHVVGGLYGKGALDHWIAGGVDFDEFETLMAWGMASANGNTTITFDEAAVLVAEASKKAASRGKAQTKKKARRKR